MSLFLGTATDDTGHFNSGLYSMLLTVIKIRCKAIILFFRTEDIIKNAGFKLLYFMSQDSIYITKRQGQAW